VLHVPSQYPTINQAIDAAVSGDSVLVAPGVYDQNETRLLGDGYWYSSVAFLRGDVALISEGGSAVATLRIDVPTPARPVILRAFGEPGTISVQGFTVTGTAPLLSGVQYGFSDRLILRDCAFRDIGTTSSDGIAVGTVKADMEVHGCRFENINGATGSAINQTSGTLLLEDSEFVNCRSGAMQLTYDSSFPHSTGAIIRRCRFSNNVDSGTGSSGGVGAYAYSNVLIEDCWFEGNRSGPGGGAVGASGPSVTIATNTFVGNSAELGSGGALWLSGSSVTVTGNTFWANWTDRNHLDGGASVAFELGGDLQNNVIAGSTGDEAVGRHSGTVQTSCNVFWANPVGNATSPLSPSDLVADPMFCDVAANDFHVNAASPCIPGNGYPTCMELIGAWGQGCGTVSVAPSSWGKVKSEFRSEGEVRR
jgi:hypothetical protein